MPGSLTIGGMADGLLAGQLVVGPSTMAGKAAISEVLNVTLVANTDYVIPVPAEAVAWAAVFTFSGTTPGEVKVGSNLVSTANGMPVPAQGWIAAPIYTGLTELKFKAVTPPPVFNVVFI